MRVMTIRGLSVGFCVLLLTGCMPVATSQPQSSLQDEAPVQSDDASACRVRGGKMQRVGRLQSWQCVVSYADAGKRCTDGDQCQGDCRIDTAPFPANGSAAVGQCQANSNAFGCFTRVEDGKADVSLCVD